MAAGCGHCLQLASEVLLPDRSGACQQHTPQKAGCQLIGTEGPLRVSESSGFLKPFHRKHKVPQYCACVKAGSLLFSKSCNTVLQARVSAGCRTKNGLCYSLKVALKAMEASRWPLGLPGMGSGKLVRRVG